MNILIVHNKYQLPGGEDIAFDNEVRLLQSRGHRVDTFIRENSEISHYSLSRKIVLPLKAVWSVGECSALKAFATEVKPDIVHFHNTFPLISPGAYYTCKSLGLPVVQTLHNYRLVCPGGKLIRSGITCHDCIGKIPWRAFFYGCYRESRVQSLALMVALVVHRLLGTWNKKVDRFICLTEYNKALFVQAGLPAARIDVKSNFLFDPPDAGKESEDYVVFVGRLDQSKGIETVIRAWEHLTDIPLKIVGEGPLRKDLESTVKNYPAHAISFSGRQPHEVTLELMQKARFVLVPSLWYEFVTLTMIEAFACGKPVLASDLTSFRDLVTDGSTGSMFRTGDSKDLASKVRLMYDAEKETCQMGKNARTLFENRFTAAHNYEKLMEIYHEVIQEQ